MAVMVNGELVLYGFVGDNFWDMGFTAKEVLDALAEHGRTEDITVRINSGGGYVDDGIAIFNALKAHAGKVTVVVDSLAASSASIIAMAGDERIMRTGALMMIHDPQGGVWGTAADMERFAKVVEKQAENLASIYAEVTGAEAADIREAMKAETWMSAVEAVDAGYATATDAKKAKPVAAHDYTIYAHAPERLAALSVLKNWKRPENSAAGSSATAVSPNRQNEEEKSMTGKTVADNGSADTDAKVAEAAKKLLAEFKDRRNAILNHEEAKGREALAAHFADNTELPLDAVVAALKASPKVEAAESPANGQSYEQRRVSAAANLATPAAAGGSDAKETWGSVLADAGLKRKGA